TCCIKIRLGLATDQSTHRHHLESSSIIDLRESAAIVYVLAIQAELWALDSAPALLAWPISVSCT
ncbi:hypothetical protein EI94DRAFT_1730011, partial [Lactarius quietus]